MARHIEHACDDVARVIAADARDDGIDVARLAFERRSRDVAQVEPDGDGKCCEECDDGLVPTVSSSVAAPVKLRPPTAAVAWASATLVLFAVGPVLFMLSIIRTPTIASEHTIATRPNVRPMARVIGRVRLSLE